MDGEVAGPYSGRGMYGDGDFWSGIVFGESATIEYLPGPTAPPAEAAPFRIVALSHIWGGPGFTGDSGPPTRAATRAEDTRETVKPPTAIVGVTTKNQPTAKAAETKLSIENSVKRFAVAEDRSLSSMPPAPSSNHFSC